MVPYWVSLAARPLSAKASTWCDKLRLCFEPHTLEQHIHFALLSALIILRRFFKGRPQCRRLQRLMIWVQMFRIGGDTILLTARGSHVEQVYLAGFSEAKSWARWVPDACMHACVPTTCPDVTP